jgi:hypothetical protein
MKAEIKHCWSCSYYFLEVCCAERELPDPILSNECPEFIRYTEEELQLIDTKEDIWSAVLVSILE